VSTGPVRVTTEIRPVRCTVTDNIVGRAIVDSYDLYADSRNGHLYNVPLYSMRLVGRDESGEIEYHDFKVVRFGVGHNGDGPDYIAGKPEGGVHALKWIAGYMGGLGCWKLSEYQQVLIHAGARHPLDTTRPPGAVGCIEITGPRAWQEFNRLVAKLAGTTDLTAISDQEKFHCELLPVHRPTLNPVGRGHL
jgi:hypothetical protein